MPVRGSLSLLPHAARRPAGEAHPYVKGGRGRGRGRGREEERGGEGEERGGEGEERGREGEGERASAGASSKHPER